VPKPLIFDATPLIYLTKASLTTTLEILPEEKLATSAVFNEVVQEGKKKKAPEAMLLQNLFRCQAIKVQDPSNKEYLEYVKEIAAGNEMQPLHEAEAEVLSLAKELKGVAVADDQIARLVARLLGIELHGTAYILGKIYLTGKVEMETLIEKIKQMRESGWYLSAEDYLRIVEYLKSI